MIGFNGSEVFTITLLIFYPSLDGEMHDTGVVFQVNSSFDIADA
jgi:hypothetical protein